MDNRDIFGVLCSRLGVQPDRRGEVHTKCPWCGKEPRRGQVHFSFSERGAHCFVCGQSASLPFLAKMLNVIDAEKFKRLYRADRTYEPRSKAQEPSEADLRQWLRWSDLAEIYQRHPDRVAKWQSYKRLSEDTIRRYHLGYGVWPEYTSQCQHPRLQVPLICWGHVVGFRGRALECDCKRWLSPKGTRPVLYNGERLADGPVRGVWLGKAVFDRVVKGSHLFIVENAVDALMLEQLGKNISAVATLSVSYWSDDWTELLAHCGARTIFVAYDNDRPGNGGGDAGREAWLKVHKRDITPAGVRLVNRLNAAGIRARLFPWPETAPLGMDVGKVLAREAV